MAEIRTRDGLQEVCIFAEGLNRLNGCFSSGIVEGLIRMDLLRSLGLWMSEFTRGSDAGTRDRYTLLCSLSAITAGEGHVRHFASLRVNVPSPPSDR